MTLKVGPFAIRTRVNTSVWQPNTSTSRYVGLLRKIGTEAHLYAAFCVKAMSRKTSSEDTWLENLKMRHPATPRPVSFRHTIRISRANRLRAHVARVLMLCPALLREEVRARVRTLRPRTLDRMVPRAIRPAHQVHAMLRANSMLHAMAGAIKGTISHRPRTLAVRSLGRFQPGLQVVEAMAAILA